MLRLLKAIFWITAVLATLALIKEIVWYCYGGRLTYLAPMERTAFQRFCVERVPSLEGTVVHVKGEILSSWMSVKGYEVSTRERAVLLTVYEGPPRHTFPAFLENDTIGSSSFDTYVTIPKNIDRLEFGSERTVIWQRSESNTARCPSTGDDASK